MSDWTMPELLQPTGGSWVVEPHENRSVTGICIDSRENLTGRAFIAIRGKQFDGHNFISQAIAAGAAVLIIDRPNYVPERTDIPVLNVNDTRQALLQLASAHRDRICGRVIGITGSCGKTTTKHLIAHVLKSKFRGTCAPKSFNNDIGVPLTLLSASMDDDYVVVEIGTNAPGEIATLAEIVRPDVAVLTNVGRSHLERLGDVEGVAREKSDLLRFVKTGGQAFVIDASLLDPFIPKSINCIRYGESDRATVRLVSCDTQARCGGHRMALSDGFTFDVPLTGRHNALNAMAAVLVGRTMNMNDVDIQAALSTVTPPPMRMQEHLIDGVRIYNDAYNANPESMAASIRAFGTLSPQAERQFLVLGEMLELGAHTAECHAELGRMIAGERALERLHRVAFVGESACHVRAGWIEAGGEADRFQSFANVESSGLAAVLAEWKEGDAVLLKGSRGVGLERLLRQFADSRACASASM